MIKFCFFLIWSCIYGLIYEYNKIGNGEKILREKGVMMMDPIAFTILGIPIRWYGLLISLGMVIAVLLMVKRAPRYRISSDKSIDIILWSIPVGVIGARLYYVIFNWSYYQGDIMKMINLRSGGLAIHGGLLAGVLFSAFLCRLWNIRILDFFDLGSPCVAIAQAIGRWGNYFNQEAYGRPTDLPWAILIDGVRVHPTFLYESLWNFGIFIFLMLLERRRRFEGQLFYYYLLLYSFARFFIEGLRTDSLMLGPIRVAQLISAIGFIVALVILIKKRNRSGKLRFR